MPNAIVYPKLTEPQRGQPLNAEWGREVVRAIKSITPISGQNTEVHRTQSGTIIRAKESGRVVNSQKATFSDPIPCKITGGDAINGYTVALHENGILQPATGEGILYVMQFNNLTFIPIGTVILGWPRAMNIVGGTEQA